MGVTGRNPNNIYGPGSRIRFLSYTHIPLFYMANFLIGLIKA
jgi:hypothetical protein